jgi:peptidoglycan/LPS O-acetylase OafA/YrhL
MKTEKNIYFSGINGLRFLAALAVIITHVELLKEMFGFKAIWKNPIIFNLGGLGVCFFFVLSGFLITYLLLVEKEKQGHINIKQFYMRRILRIWPLYYLIMLLGFFVLPQFTGIQIPYLQNDFVNHYNTNLILYLLILPNLAFSLFPAVPHIGQAWSIGVEEQFYLVWPWLISRTRHVVKTLIIITLSLVLFKVLVLLLGHYFCQSSWYIPLKRFVAMSKFECMAIGGIGGYFIFSNDKLLAIIYNRHLLNLSIVLIPLLIFFTPGLLQDGVHLVYAVLFLIIILNVANGSVKINLENKLFNYLGKISYGIYMYHLMIIPIVLYVVKHFLGQGTGMLFNITVYSLSILGTITVAGLSYKFLEEPFIKLKSKFTTVKSGESNKE